MVQAAAAAAAAAAEANDSDDEAKVAAAAAGAAKESYDYLLSMAIYSLTWEKVQVRATHRRAGCRPLQAPTNGCSVLFLIKHSALVVHLCCHRRSCRGRFDMSCQAGDVLYGICLHAWPQEAVACLACKPCRTA